MAFHVALVDLADSPRLARTYRNVAAELRLAFLKIDDPAPCTSRSSGRTAPCSTPS